MKAFIAFVLTNSVCALSAFAYGHVMHASPGRVTTCTHALAKLKQQDPQSYVDHCREGKDGAVTLYDSRSSVLKTDTGSGVEEKPFDSGLAMRLLQIHRGIQEVFFNSDTHQWGVYGDSQASGDLQQVYLLPENFKAHDVIITLSAPANPKSQLIDQLEFDGDQIDIAFDGGAVVSVKNEVPDEGQMRRMAYEFFDVRYTGLRFLENGIKNFPIYDKIKALVEKCDLLQKEEKRAKCYDLEEVGLASELLVSTRANDPQNSDLLQFLADKNLRTNVVGSLVDGYRKNLASEALDRTYDWSKVDFPVATHRGGDDNYFLHYTYDFTHGIAVFSPGMEWDKFDYSVRYAYYPIAPITP